MKAHLLHAEIETKTRKDKNRLKYIAVCVSKTIEISSSLFVYHQRNEYQIDQK